jgi:hypothetical protein
MERFPRRIGCIDVQGDWRCLCAGGDAEQQGARRNDQPASKSS